MAEVEAIFIDVGQGDSTLVKLPGDQFLLVDVCRKPGAGIDSFKLLDDRLPMGANGRRRVEHVLITHAHDDHIDGIGDLAERYEIGTLWVPRYEAHQSLGANFEAFEEVVAAHPEGDKRFPEGSRSPIARIGADESVALHCFSPPGYVEVGSDLDEAAQRELVHEHCVVVRLDYAGYRILFAGDSNLACWQRIEPYFSNYTDDRGAPILTADLLHASHHGSRTFFTDQGEDSELWLAALEAIGPSSVIVSVGEDNRFDHPHAEAIAAYRHGAGDDQVYETQSTGTVIVEVESDGTAQLFLDDGTYAEDYGWDDEVYDDDAGDGDDAGPGSKAAGIALGAALAAGVGGAAIARRKRRARLDDQPAA